jgi:hypothetical protein
VGRRRHFRVVHQTMSAAIASAIAISTRMIQKPSMRAVFSA